jgi:SecD/SecF fusion protein
MNMKIKMPSPVQIIAALFILIFTSCSAKPDMSKGLKVTVRISLKDAIVSAAINPNDTTISTALDNTDTTQTSAEAFVSSFIEAYSKRYPGENINRHFLAGETTEIAISTETEKLKRLLTEAINTKRSEMATTVARRIEQFCEIPQKNIMVDFQGQLMIVTIPGVANTQRLKPVFESPTGIRLWSTVKMSELGSYLVKVNDTLTKELITAKTKEISKDSAKDQSLIDLALKEQPEQNTKESLFKYMARAIDAEGRDISASYIGITRLEDTGKVNALLHRKSTMSILPGNIKWMWGELPGTNTKQKIVALYAIRPSPSGEPLINAHDIQEASAEKHHGKWEIYMSMTPAGTIKWARATEENINRAIAIEIGNYVYSAPNVMDKISVGKCSISSDFNESEAKELAGIVDAGGYPLSFKVIGMESFTNKNNN